MLGRLFRQNPTGTGPSKPSPPQPGISYEDLYTRGLLYATSAGHLKPFTSSSTNFRVLVAQDGGLLRSKQILFDLAIEPETSGSEKEDDANGDATLVDSSPGSLPESPGIRPSARRAHRARTDSPPSHAPPVASAQLPARLRPPSAHALHLPRLRHAELTDYMFGGGIPTVESHYSTKIHTLAGSSPRAVLITKLFSVVPSDAGGAGGDFHDDTFPWLPRPTFPIKETNRLVGAVNSRFAIAVMIPLETLSDFADVVVDNWPEISHFLIVLQKAVVKKLIMALNSNTTTATSATPPQNTYIINKRLQFPSYLLQNDSDLILHKLKLVNLFHYNCNIPKLINTHSLLRVATTSANSRFNPYLINWVLEVLNWLEFKEGRFSTGVMSENITASPTSFLASLFALILPLRHKLAEKPLSPSNSRSKEVNRVVFMTGNPVVAKKLVFIVNGLIPDTEFYSGLAADTSSTQTSTLTSTASSPKSPSSLKSPEFPKSPEFSKLPELSKSKSPNLRSNLSKSDFTKSPDLKSNFPKPPDLKSNLSKADFSKPPDLKSDFSKPPHSKSDFSKSSDFSNSYSPKAQPIPIKGFETDYDKDDSNPDSFNSQDSLAKSVSSVKGWEIPQKSVASTSFSSKPMMETANSVEKRRPSLSKTSSVAYLSSSLNSSLSSSASSYSLSKLGGSFLDKWKNPFTGTYDSSEYVPPAYGSLSKRLSVNSLRTSPAVENEDYYFHPQTPTTHGISRVQSMIDLYGSDKKIGAFHAEHKKNAKLVSMLRSKSSVYTPVLPDDCKTFDTDRESIRSRCEQIFALDPQLSEKDGTLYVETSDKEDLHQRNGLLSNVAFVDEFRPEFSLQSCPVSSKLESQVMTSMKNDLLFNLNNCGYEGVTSRTIFISLRAREIKLIEMTVGGASSDEKKNISYKTTIKKVFSLHKNSGNKELIQSIDTTFEKMNQLVKYCHSDELHDRLMQQVRKIIE